MDGTGGGTESGGRQAFRVVHQDPFRDPGISECIIITRTRTLKRKQDLGRGVGSPGGVLARDRSVDGVVVVVDQERTHVGE